eukprot:540184-Alexandrium_andersonii.AAC.1
MGRNNYTRPALFALQQMHRNAPPRLEQFGVVSCAPLLRLPGGAPDPRTPKSASGVRESLF